MALHEYQKHMYKRIGIIVALIILPIAGFFAGAAYQKQTAPSTAQAVSQRSFGSRFGGIRNRAIGTVKAIDSTSITVTSRSDNTDKTYQTTSNTTYKHGTDDALASDIKVGDTVLVSLDRNDTSKALTITINPNVSRSARLQ